jgi:hypothetical protein
MYGFILRVYGTAVMARKALNRFSAIGKGLMSLKP